MARFPLDADGQPIVPPMCAQEQRAWLRLAASNDKPVKSARIWLASRGGVQREFPTKRQAEAYAAGQ